MAMYKRGKIWWFQISHNGQRIQRSSGTENRQDAQRLHDKIKSELWKTTALGDPIDRTWQEAVIRWLNESALKESIDSDKLHLRWLDEYFRDFTLKDLTRDEIERVAVIKENEGVKPATVNRMLEVIRAILRKAHREWDWLASSPVIRMRKEPVHRIRWITPVQAQALLKELPDHLSKMAAFSLATGLHAANVRNLKWLNVDLENEHAWIEADEAKGNKPIAVPLNSDAINILHQQLGIHPVFVFVFKGAPVSECNTKAWRKALQRAGIENFRWHDLRHTWASWHVQNGTTLQELQQLGGWSSLEMVLRYAHLSGGHLKSAAARIASSNLNIRSFDTIKVSE